MESDCRGFAPAFALVVGFCFDIGLAPGLRLAVDGCYGRCRCRSRPRHVDM